MLHIKIVRHVVEVGVSMSWDVNLVDKSGIHGHSLAIHMRTRRTTELLPWMVHASKVSAVDRLLSCRQVMGVSGAASPVMGGRWSRSLAVLLL